MNCLILGAGQLGSRHLQAILKFNTLKLRIFVIDISLDSLIIAQSRSAEIKHSHEISFSTDFKLVPNEIFLAIVATNSKEREKSTIDLLKQFQIEYIILEKVLFPNLDAYDNVLTFLNSTSTKCYVNHSRRLFDGYNYLKNNYKLNSNLNVQVAGSNWGLGCNALHYIDLIEFITGRKLINLNTDSLDRRILKSKRNGYVEFTGTLYGCLDNNIDFTISSYNTKSITSPAISIMNGDLRMLIQESESLDFNIYSHSEGFVLSRMKFEIPFQSSMTNLVLFDLIQTGNTNLTTYEEASITHKIFIDAMLKFYNNMNPNSNNSSIPIT